MDLPGKQKILLLRSESHGPDKYGHILREHGYNVYDVPTLDFVYQDLDTLREQLNAPSLFSGIVFTSPRAVTATREAFGGNLSTTAWANKLCFVVGHKTGVLVCDMLGLSHTGSEAGNAALLADDIATAMTDKRLPLLFPCGNLKRETLPNKMKDAGIGLHCCTVYSTQRHPCLTTRLTECLELKPDFVVYFSPSGVNFSVDVIKNSGCYEKIKHVSIGPSTKEALGKAGVEVFASALTPCPEAVLEIVNNATT